jgi:hypothetical protein
MDCWAFVGHAVKLRLVGWTLVATGVGVKLDGEEHVAIAYGGHRDAVDEEAVTRATRAALVSWPEPIRRVEIVVDEPQRLSDYDRAALARAEAKRVRRAERYRARAARSGP